MKFVNAIVFGLFLVGCSEPKSSRRNVPQAGGEKTEKSEKEKPQEKKKESEAKGTEEDAETKVVVGPTDKDKDCEVRYVSVAGGANVRPTAGFEQEPIFTCSQGAFVYITGKEGDWFKVTLGSGEKGYTKDTLLSCEKPKNTEKCSIPKKAEDEKSALLKEFKGTLLADGKVKGDFPKSLRDQCFSFGGSSSEGICCLKGDVTWNESYFFQLAEREKAGLPVKKQCPAIEDKKTISGAFFRKGGGKFDSDLKMFVFYSDKTFVSFETNDGIKYSSVAAGSWEHDKAKGKVMLLRAYSGSSNSPDKCGFLPKSEASEIGFNGTSLTLGDLSKVEKYSPTVNQKALLDLGFKAPCPTLPNLGFPGGFK